ncbi:MAG: amidohydrolase family protein, partial [Chloroflexi bacterium]|nr:amidohydrolase family protein [Chloroflexota bacterium]
MADTPLQQAVEKADVLLKGGIVITMDAQRRIFSPGAVALRGRDILAVGPEEEIEARYAAAQTLDCREHILMPGLINTHTHLPMSLLRGLADDLRLDVWLHGYILPVEREFVTPEFCFLGTLLACAEMLRGGVTCFADMYYHEEEVA